MPDIDTIEKLISEIKDNGAGTLESGTHLLEVYDIQGNKYDLVEVYQSDDNERIICFDVRKRT